MKEKRFYPDGKIKKWFCEKCDREITKEDNRKTLEPSASYPHRKAYCLKCWNE